MTDDQLFSIDDLMPLHDALRVGREQAPLDWRRTARHHELFGCMAVWNVTIESLIAQTRGMGPMSADDIAEWLRGEQWDMPGLPPGEGYSDDVVPLTSVGIASTPKQPKRHDPVPAVRMLPVTDSSYLGRVHAQPAVFGQILNRFIRRSGIGDVQAAEVLGIATWDLPKLTAGTYFPSTTSLRRIRDAWGITITDLEIALEQERAA